MAIAILQAWTGTSGTAVSSLSRAYVSTPTTGNLLVCCAAVVGVTDSLSFSDDLADGVSWSVAISLAVTGTATVMYIAYKVVGSSPVGKTVTITPLVAANCEISTVEYSGTATSSPIDGTSTSNQSAASANPDPGAITVAAGSVGVGYVNNLSTPNATAGTGYTRRRVVAAIAFSCVEDLLGVAAGTTDPKWTHTSDAWGALGVAFKVAGGTTVKVPWPLLMGMRII